MRKLRTTPDGSETIVHKKTCRCEVCDEMRVAACEQCGSSVHVEEKETTYARVCDICGARGTKIKSEWGGSE